MDVIDKAIQVLHDQGWVQGTEYRPGDGYCLQGALKVACSQWYGTVRHDLARRDFNVPRYERVTKVCQDQIKIRTHGRTWEVPRWNDHFAKSVDEVIEVLKLAGEELDRQAERRARIKAGLPVSG